MKIRKRCFLRGGPHRFFFSEKTPLFKIRVMYQNRIFQNHTFRAEVRNIYSI